MLSYADRLIEVGEHERALELAGGALHIAGLRDDALGMAHAHLRLGRALRAGGRQAEAVQRLRKAVKSLEESDDLEVAQQAVLELARALESSGDRKGAIEGYATLHRHALQRDDRAGAANALEAIGALHTVGGDQRSALEAFHSALELREALEDRDAIALAHTNVGIVHGQLGEYREALSRFSSALEIVHAGTNRLLEVRTLVNASRAHYALGELDPALRIAFAALEIFEQLGDEESIPGVLSDIGSIHERLGKLDIALRYYRKALDLVRDRPPDGLQVRLFLSVANLYISSGEYGDALGIATQALELARELGERGLEYQVNFALATTWEALDDPRRALEHYKAYTAIRDEVQGAEMRRSIAEMQMRFDVERTAREREIYRLKSEQLERDMDHKKSELTAMALNLLQKNELLDKLTEQIRQLGQTPAEEVRRRSRTLLNQIADGRSADDSWKVFEQQLMHLHGNFIERVAQRYPDLSPTELKVCSMLKLGLTSKQIGELLGIVERTVQNHRYNIKGKIMPADSPTRLAAMIAGM